LTLGVDQLLGQVQDLIVLLTRIAGFIAPFQHPNLVVKALLDDSLGLLLKVWFGFILRTTDFETGAPFTTNVTVRQFEPAVRLAANSGLALVVVWAAYRMMWSQGATSLYAARLLLPRLFMGALLINFSLPLFQAMVDASNAMSDAIRTFGTIPLDWRSWWSSFALDPTAGTWQIISTAALIAGYDILGVAYLVRYTILIVLAITAPLAGLLFILPDTHHMAKQWASFFFANLFMQPVQLFVLAIGFALENGGHTPVHHLFALAALLIMFKVPGALGGPERVAHRLEMAVKAGAKVVQKAVVHA
jgi:hypothetical protein